MIISWSLNTEMSVLKVNSVPWMLSYGGRKHGRGVRKRERGGKESFKKERVVYRLASNSI